MSICNGLSVQLDGLPSSLVKLDVSDTSFGDESFLLLPSSLQELTLVHNYLSLYFSPPLTIFSLQSRPSVKSWKNIPQSLKRLKFLASVVQNDDVACFPEVSYFHIPSATCIFNAYEFLFIYVVLDSGRTPYLRDRVAVAQTTTEHANQPHPIYIHAHPVCARLP